MTFTVRYYKHKNNDDFEEVDKRDITTSSEPHDISTSFFQEVEKKIEEVNVGFDSDELDDFVSHGLTTIEFFSQDRDDYYQFELFLNDEAVISEPEFGLCLDYNLYKFVPKEAKIASLAEFLTKKIKSENPS